MCVCLWYKYGCMCATALLERSEGNILESVLFPLWIQGIELRPSGKHSRRYPLSRLTGRLSSCSLAGSNGNFMFSVLRSWCCFAQWLHRLCSHQQCLSALRMFLTEVRRLRTDKEENINHS